MRVTIFFRHVILKTTRPPSNTNFLGVLGPYSNSFLPPISELRVTRSVLLRVMIFL